MGLAEFFRDYQRFGASEKERRQKRRHARERSRSGGVYFIRAANGLVKIGKTVDLPKRFQSMQGSSPIPLEIVGWIPEGGEEREWELHERFAQYRTHGEWFHSSPELESLIKQHSYSYP